jgi:hypothetical protein
VDGLTVVDCSFLRNGYHLKIGPRLSGSIHIVRNDFIEWSKGIRVADIWIVPNNTELYGVNAGYGLVIADNKFGNENQSAAEARILIANEDSSSGQDRLSRKHSIAFARHHAYVAGVTIARNRISGIGKCAAPFIRCFIDDFWRLSFKENTLDGGPYTYLCEFMQARPADESSFTNNTWDIDIGSPPAGAPPFLNGIANREVGSIRDSFGAMQGSRLLPQNTGGGSDVGYESLLEQQDLPSPPLAVSRCDVRFVPDTYGKTLRGVEITYLEKASVAYCALRRPHTGSSTWIELDLRLKEPEIGVGAIVEVVNFKSSSVAVQQMVALSPVWVTARIPFIFPATSAPDAWQLRIRATPKGSPPSTLLVARLQIYHAAQPMLNGHLRTLGSGRWDGEHIVVGPHHLWFDDDGMLRLKRGEPTHSRDGSLLSGRWSP